ncbi:MAG: Flp pilus assembly protein CpaB [Hyphomonadaceae bacterium]|nr:Flp pilus assembly protein CpaB [Hyphomonadaceae bacterium]
MSARQLIILAVAFIAAAGALFLIRGMSNVRPAPAVAADVQMGRVLVAAREIPQGAALESGDLQWRPFPPETINANFVKESDQPAALTEMNGWVARRAFLAGEPIVKASVISPDGRGFLAAQLLPGYRAVSLKIDRETAVGGYIQPNDRVDVMLTTETDVERDGGGGDKEVRTDVVLENVRIMAIGEHTQPPEAGRAPEPIDGGYAIIELSAADARTLAYADALGNLSLTLRGVEVEPPGLRVASAAKRGAGALDQNVRELGSSVRVHSYGNSSVARGGR